MLYQAVSSVSCSGTLLPHLRGGQRGLLVRTPDIQASELVFYVTTPNIDLKVISMSGLLACCSPLAAQKCSYSLVSCL